ncbi:MAG: GNAT family N-acetyltransferase [Gemmataceae bacterium]
MPPRIRQATPADAAVLVEFNRLLALESEGKTLDPDLLTPGVAAALADPRKALYFVAEQDGHIQGQMMVTYEWSDWRNGWFWWVQSVYVRPEVRRAGVFRSLFEHVQAQARAQPDVIGIRLYVEEENQRAQHTYRNMGLDKTTYFVMEKYPLG